MLGWRELVIRCYLLISLMIQVIRNIWTAQSPSSKLPETAFITRFFVICRLMWKDWQIISVIILKFLQSSSHYNTSNDFHLYSADDWWHRIVLRISFCIHSPSAIQVTLSDCMFLCVYITLAIVVPSLFLTLTICVTHISTRGGERAVDQQIYWCRHVLGAVFSGNRNL